MALNMGRCYSERHGSLSQWEVQVLTVLLLRFSHEPAVRPLSTSATDWAGELLVTNAAKCSLVMPRLAFDPLDSLQTKSKARWLVLKWPSSITSEAEGFGAGKFQRGWACYPCTWSEREMLLLCEQLKAVSSETVTQELAEGRSLLKTLKSWGRAEGFLWD